MSWDASTITNAAPWATLSGKLQVLVGGAGVANWSYVEQIPAGTGAGQSGSALYAVDVFKCAGTGTNANAAGTDWYFCLEIPVTDGAVVSACMAFEAYDATAGQKTFKRPLAAPTTSIPTGAGYWRDDTYAKYASVTGTNRANLIFTALNTSGFSYWIKLTNNLVQIAVRVSSTQCSIGVHLLDSLTTVTDTVPLASVVGGTLGGGTLASGSVFHALPSVTVAPTATTGWRNQMEPWISIVADGILSNAVSDQDLWTGAKILVARVLCTHAAGRATSKPATLGTVRGLLKTDIMCFPDGGTVQLGDTMTFGGNADWTVIGPAGLYGGGPGMALITRAV